MPRQWPVGVAADSEILHSRPVSATITRQVAAVKHAVARSNTRGMGMDGRQQGTWRGNEHAIAVLTRLDGEA